MLAVLGPNLFFGHEDLFRKKTRSFTVVSESDDCQVYFIKADKVLKEKELIVWVKKFYLFLKNKT